MIQKLALNVSLLVMFISLMNQKLAGAVCFAREDSWAHMHFY